MNVLRKVYKRDPQLRARHALNFKPAWFKRHLEASKLALEIKDRMNTATTEGIQGTEMDVLRAEWEGITRSFPDRNFAEGKAELELRKQMSEIEKLPWRKRVIPESGRRLPYLNMKSEKYRAAIFYWFFGVFPTQQQKKKYKREHGQEELEN